MKDKTKICSGKCFNYAYMLYVPTFSIHYSQTYLLIHVYAADTVQTKVDKNQAQPQEPVSLLGKRTGVLYTVGSAVKFELVPVET